MFPAKGGTVSGILVFPEGIPRPPADWKDIGHATDPAHGKYWRMYNELEAKQVMSKKFDLPANVFEK